MKDELLTLPDKNKLLQWVQVQKDPDYCLTVFITMHYKGSNVY